MATLILQSAWILMVVVLCIVFTIKISISITNEDLKKRDEALKNINDLLEHLVKENKKIKRNETKSKKDA